jgi:hypothetical protein
MALWVAVELRLLARDEPLFTLRLSILAIVIESANGMQVAMQDMKKRDADAGG